VRLAFPKKCTVNRPTRGWSSSLRPRGTARPTRPRRALLDGRLKRKPIPNPSRILFQIDLSLRRTMAVAALRNIVAKIRIPLSSSLRSWRASAPFPSPPPPKVCPVPSVSDTALGWMISPQDYATLARACIMYERVCLIARRRPICRSAVSSFSPISNLVPTPIETNFNFRNWPDSGLAVWSCLVWQQFGKSITYAIGARLVCEYYLHGSLIEYETFV
jgi:hypothetical protein